MACISDMNRPPYSVEASNYYQLARVALGLDSVIDHPTLQAVRSIVRRVGAMREMTDGFAANDDDVPADA